nr:MAG TPA: hypothetical protein [Caudoviricetes sp.]
MGSHLRLTRKAKSKDMLISWEDLLRQGTCIDYLHFGE